MKRTWGWITPSRRFIPTSSYEHFKEIGKDSELRSLVPEYVSMEGTLSAIQNNCEDLIAQGDHPEWHCYEMAADDFRYEAIFALYKAGCIRVGTHESDLCFEGTSEGIQNLYQFCKDFAEEREMVCKFEPRKN